MNKVLILAWDKRRELKAEGYKIWAEGDKLKDEGNKLRDEGYKLRDEGYKIWAEGYKIWAEGHKLRAEGDKLWAEGDKLWAETVIKVYGNITLEWKDEDCYLETGEVFKWEKNFREEVILASLKKER